MKTIVFGESCKKLPIVGHQFGQSGPKVLILGGVHGDEREGVVCALGLLKAFTESFAYQLQLTLVPTFNIDGVLLQQRTNANRVDLNRNLPTKDWSSEFKTERYFPGPQANSEPENQALTAFIEKEKPLFILSLHSWKPLLNVNGDCDPEAQTLTQETGYEIHRDIGYPTPGCLGTYTGHERNIPTITYEIERDLDDNKNLNLHIPAILKALKQTEKRTPQ